ncbi:DNA-binding response regulator [Actinosynnema sp. ALI-1.44]|uniref:response regulator transcription factor n=1 Tax=Actinosynnema sp. ALI-1.44 TaxID=1933779 RepID=UPI00097C3C30|nr:response regulator transcription factor [Actinosynnema sp. ALI-1.44]ONI70957.1 DNA-binding response regulator [Actinosynnema sp. ALI-1.44]
MIRVVLADDEAMVRAGIAAILGSDPGIEVAAQAGTGREAVDQVARHRPDIAVLDIQMPELDGLTAAAEIKRLRPETGVVMLTTFGEDAYIERALSLGANGFLVKSGDPTELIAGIRAVADGAAFLSPRVAKRVIDQLPRSNSGARDRISVLTPRETEVLALLGSGLSNADIAARVHIVEGTVKAHVSAILGRLGVRNRVQAAILAYQAGLVQSLD